MSEVGFMRVFVGSVFTEEGRVCRFEWSRGSGYIGKNVVRSFVRVFGDVEFGVRFWENNLILCFKS